MTRKRPQSMCGFVTERDGNTKTCRRKYGKDSSKQNRKGTTSNRCLTTMTTDLRRSERRSPSISIHSNSSPRIVKLTQQQRMTQHYCESAWRTVSTGWIVWSARRLSLKVGWCQVD